VSNTIPSSLLGSPPFPGAVLLEVWDYGEGQTNDKEKNLRGQLYQYFDGSGKQQINEYDFKGNPLETEQKLLEDPTITDADWSGTPPALSAEVFTSSVTYDALNRPVTTTDPGNNVHEFTYDKAGLLKTVTLNSDVYVQDIHYNSKGQRNAIWYGNGTKTIYTYDPATFRLRRLLTVNVDTLSAHYNEILQDLHYWYDPVGNITEIQDYAQQTLFYNNSVVAPTQKFIYDALYRLIEAKGRELIGTASFGAEDNWNDAAWQTTHKGDGNAVQNYTQHYTYDEVGNIVELQHVAATGSYTRTYDIDTGSNRLLETVVGMTTYEYDYDARGNMVEMPHLSSMVWNMDNELSSTVKGGNPTHYQYSGGQRVRKYTDKGSLAEERIYLGNFELYRKYDNSGDIDVERSTVHISDDTGRIAMLEVLNTDYNSDGAEEVLTRYIYSNHLQSASLELDGNAEIISYEEYHPYGTTAYQAMNASVNAVAKRYRYTGKERDEESGLYYHGARYYIPWLARWTAVDALESEMPAWSSYNYGFCNPLIFNDPSGMQPEDTQKEEQKPKPYKPEPEKGTKSGFMEASTEDGLYMGVSAMFELEEVTIRAKPKNSWKDRLSNIGKGIVVGLVIAVAVAGIVVTGGAALAAMGIAVSAASMATVGTALTITGGAFTAYNTVQSLRERDLLNNEISQEEADYNLGMGIGGMLAGPMAKLGGKFGGKSIAGNIFKPKTGAGVTQPDAAKGVTTVFQKHHIIPNQVYKTFKTDLKAMGWKQNDMFNLKKLPTPFHGNHPAYNNFIMNEMNMLKQSGNLNLNSMQNLQHNMRLMIGDAYRSGGTLNQYFKF
jgi:RHS repeat-associated protein